MAKLSRQAGTTSQIVSIFVMDTTSTTGAGKTALTNASFSCYYKRNTDAASVAVTLDASSGVTLGTYEPNNAAHGAIKEIDATNMPGLYEFQPPNNGFAAGADEVTFMLTGSGIRVNPIEFELTAINNQSTAFGLSIAKTTNITGFNDIAATAVVSSGAITTSGGAVSTVTTVTNQLTAAAIATGVWTDTTAGDFTVSASVGKSVMNGVALGTGLTVANLTNAPTAGDFTATMKTSIGTAVAASAVASVTGNVGGNVTGSVGSIASGGITNASYAANTGKVTIRSNTAAAGGSTSITLDAGASSSNSFYNNDLVYITGGTGVGQARFITAYVGSTQVATVSSSWSTNPDNTSTFAILPFDAIPGATAPTAAQVATAVWQDTTAGDFTTSGSIGKSLFTSGAVPGAAGGIFIAGTNAATSITTGLTAHIIGTVDTVTTVTNQLTAAAIATGVWTDTTAGDFTTSASIGKSVMNGVALGTGLTINAYTGNTVQTGDSYARIGSTGSGLTSLATPTNITAGTITTVTNLTNAPTAGDFTSTMKTSIGTAVAASAVASVTAPVAITSNRKKGSTATFEFLMQDATTGAPKTGLTVASTISKDGGASASTANSVTEIGLGQYQIVLTGTEMTANNVFLQFTSAGAVTSNLSIQTQP